MEHALFFMPLELYSRDAAYKNIYGLELYSRDVAYKNFYGLELFIAIVRNLGRDESRPYTILHSMTIFTGVFVLFAKSR